MSTLRAALGGDFSGWPGLPETLTPAAAINALSPAETAASAVPLQRMHQQMWMLSLKHTAAAELCELWLSHDQQRVLCIEIYEPRQWDAASALTTLGEPDLVWHNRCFALGAAVNEHVFARRGVVLAVARGIDTPAPPWVFHAQLFAPMPLEDFISDIGPGLAGLPQTGSTP
jgi:hypothetical protein